MGSSWKACTKTCGGSLKSRLRAVKRHASFSGAGCKSLSETVPCNTEACPHRSEARNCNSHGCPVDCVASKWGKWGACDATCGSAWKFRTRAIDRLAEYGGKICPTLKDSKACNLKVCPRDCVLKGFGGFSACSKRC